MLQPEAKNQRYGKEIPSLYKTLAFREVRHIGIDHTWRDGIHADSESFLEHDEWNADISPRIDVVFSNQSLSGLAHRRALLGFCTLIY